MIRCVNDGERGGLYVIRRIDKRLKKVDTFGTETRQQDTLQVCLFDTLVCDNGIEILLKLVLKGRRYEIGTKK